MLLTQFLTRNACHSSVNCKVGHFITSTLKYYLTAIPSNPIQIHGRYSKKTNFLILLQSMIKMNANGIQEARTIYHSVFLYTESSKCHKSAHGYNQFQTGQLIAQMLSIDRPIKRI